VTPSYAVGVQSREGTATQVARTSTSVFVVAEQTTTTKLFRFAPGVLAPTVDTSVGTESNLRVAAASDTAIFVSSNTLTDAKLRRVRLTGNSLIADAARTFPGMEIAQLAVFNDAQLGASLAILAICRAPSANTACVQSGAAVLGFMPITP
jgi:hypothetical protein